MSDPVRLLQSLTRDGAVARSLRESAVVPELSDAKCEELWGALARRLPEAALVAAAGGAGAAMNAATVKAGAAKVAASKAAGLAMFIKAAVAVGVVCSVAAVAVTRAWSPSSTSASAPQPLAAEARSVATVTTLPSPAPEGPVPQPTSPASATAVPPAPSVIARRPPAPIGRARSADAAPRPESGSSLEEESAMILRARQALRSGKCVAALRELQASQARFPEATLAQEREVLSIEALACAGQTTQAEGRADAFARDYPTSPHAATKAGASGGRPDGR